MLWILIHMLTHERSHRYIFRYNLYMTESSVEGLRPRADKNCCNGIEVAWIVGGDGRVKVL